MRIIKYGHLKPHIWVCRHCGCVFEWVVRDIKELNGTYFVHCPVCGGANIVPKKRSKGFKIERLKPCPVCKTAKYITYMDDGWRAGIKCRRCGTKAIYGTCMEDAAYFGEPAGG